MKMPGKQQRKLAASCLVLRSWPWATGEVLEEWNSFKVQPSGGLHWDKWAIAIVFTLATKCVCLRGLATTSQAQTPDRDGPDI
jgi:hypothetical protein